MGWFVFKISSLWLLVTQIIINKETLLRIGGVMFIGILVVAIVIGICYDLIIYLKRK